jgi:DNA-directed RNA polymerase specialized sigma24 family protein
VIRRWRSASLNKAGSDDTHSRVRQKGATPAQLEQLYRDRFEHFARVTSAICGDLDLRRDAVQAAFMAAIVGKRLWGALTRFRLGGAYVGRTVVRPSR